MCHYQEIQCEQALYIQIRLFTAKKNEVLKQVAYVNYTLNNFKELALVLGDFMFAENCRVQKFYLVMLL